MPAGIEKPNKKAPSRSEVGALLGRIKFEASEDVQYLHTSAAANWRGAFLTHMRTGAVGSFEGCWSWLRLSGRIAPSIAQFPRGIGDPAGPADAQLQVGVPGKTYAGSWTEVGESTNLFIAPALIESILHAPYSETLILEAARQFHFDVVVEHLLKALLADISGGSPDGPVLGETIVAAIVQRLHARRPVPVNDHGARLSPSELRNLQAYVRENLAGPLHLNDLAGHLDISIRHLCRTLRATVGLAPHQYVVRCRLEHARQLLAAGKLSLDDVAEASGFADRNHMSTTFRRVLDVTPLQLRHSCRQNFSKRDCES